MVDLKIKVLELLVLFDADPKKINSQVAGLVVNP
jgi:hypothetical protein